MNKEEKEKFYKDNKAKIEEELSLAKIDVIQTPSIKFLSSVIFKRDPQFKSDLPMPTAGADGKNIYVDVEFWSKLNRKQRFRALFHEGFHNMMGHCNTRVNTETDRKLWNIAADCVTEAIATQCNVGQGGYTDGVICPSSCGTVNLNINGKKIIVSDCQNKSVEEIYGVLKKHSDQYKGKGGIIDIRDENGKVVGSFDAHGLREFTPEEANDLEQELRHALVEHKLKGTMPGGLADMLERMLKGKVNWRAELRDVVIPEIKAYQSYYRPHKKGMAEGLILPVMRKEGVKVHLAGDTSGSIGKGELGYFTGEITHLFNQFDPGIVTGTLMLHHTHVYQTIPLDDVKDLDKIRTESGGTSHEDVFEKAEEDDANVLILLTDGHSDFPEYTTIKKVLWICTDERGFERIPENLGKKILVDIKEFQEE